MKYDKVRMATLLNKFRIEFGSVEIVVGLDQEPGQKRYSSILSSNSNNVYRLSIRIIIMVYYYSGKSSFCF